MKLPLLEERWFVHLYRSRCHRIHRLSCMVPFNCFSNKRFFLLDVWTAYPRFCPIPACGCRIHKITWRQASDTNLDSASASRTKQILSVKAVPQLSVRAAVLPTRHVFDIHYNNVGNHIASPPDRRSSKITFGPGILAGLFQ